MRLRRSVRALSSLVLSTCTVFVGCSAHGKVTAPPAQAPQPGAETVVLHKV